MTPQLLNFEILQEPFSVKISVSPVTQKLWASSITKKNGGTFPFFLASNKSFNNLYTIISVTSGCIPFRLIMLAFPGHINSCKLVGLSEKIFNFLMYSIMLKTLYFILFS